MASAESFLARVKQAAAQGRQYRPHITAAAEGIGYLGASGDLVQRFATEVRAVGGEAFIASGYADAAHRLKQLLEETPARSALCWEHAVLERLGLKALLADARVTALDHAALAGLAAEERRRSILACDVGITSCDWAIAETGSLMMCARPGQERMASLTPPVHIAVVERPQIVPDLIDAFERLAGVSGGQLPSNVTLITGPSKTGDIELQLTTGVHGPGKWRVIVIEGGGR